MKVKAKKTLKRRLTFEEAKDLECQLMRRQRRGAIPLCYRPKPKERDEGEEPKCQLKYFLPAPTFRFCPQCAIYRRNVSSLWSHRSKKAKEILVEEFRSANFDTIARDKTQLLAINSQLAKELGEKKALLAGLQQEKNEMKAALRDWNVAMQEQYSKNQSLAEQVREGQNQISSLTFHLGREVNDHQATKQLVSATQQSYEGQLNQPTAYQPQMPAYQVEAPFYQTSYQQIA
jgi:hypothetical protein